MNEDLNDIIRTMKQQENGGVLTDGVTETVKDKRKRKEDGCLGVLLETLDASMPGNILTGKGALTAEQDLELMVKNVQHHSSANIQITMFFNCEPRFNGVYS